MNEWNKKMTAIIYLAVNSKHLVNAERHFPRNATPGTRQTTHEGLGTKGPKHLTRGNTHEGPVIAEHTRYGIRTVGNLSFAFISTSV